MNVDFSAIQANARVAEIRKELQASHDLRSTLLRAGVPEKSFDTFFGVVSGFPWKEYEKPELVRERNEKFENAIAKFSAAAQKFEEQANVSLLTINEALRLRDDWQPALTTEEDRVLSRSPTVRLFEYLDSIRQRVTGGDYGAYRWIDPQIDTPAGRLPSKPTSKAAWLSIRALRMVHAKPGNSFNHAAALTASILCSVQVDDDTIATMVRQEAASHAGDPEGMC